MIQPRELTLQTYPIGRFRTLSWLQAIVNSIFLFLLFRKHQYAGIKSVCLYCEEPAERNFSESARLTREFAYCQKGQVIGPLEFLISLPLNKIDCLYYKDDFGKKALASVFK